MVLHFYVLIMYQILGTNLQQPENSHFLTYVHSSLMYKTFLFPITNFYKNNYVTSELESKVSPKTMSLGYYNMCVKLNFASRNTTYFY